MKVDIDPSGGMAGDMFAAALISAGAEKSKMLHAMTTAAEKLGPSSIKLVSTNDGASQLRIKVDHKYRFLSGHQAYHLLEDVFDDLKIEEPYRGFGFSTLQILIDAEKKAHRENEFLTDQLHHHSHEHTHAHTHEHIEEDAYLHEAQDILIDITGAVIGLELLHASVEADLIAPVSLGGGGVWCSHGQLPVPAPATANIINDHHISSVKGPISVELCTPTGAALLAALKVKQVKKPIEKYVCVGASCGTLNYPVPSLKVLLH